MASTNSVTLSRKTPCSFSVKLWLICVSHGAVPLSRAFCLIIFLFIALGGHCGLCFGNCPKWKRQGVALQLETGKWEHRVCSERKGIGKVAFSFHLHSVPVGCWLLCGFDFSFSAEILQFVDHCITSQPYKWWLCPHNWEVHPAHLLAAPGFTFLQSSSALLSKPCRKYFYLCPLFINWFLWLHYLKFLYSVCECHKILSPAQPRHIRFGFFQSVLTCSWAIAIVQTQCCTRIRSDHIADLGLSWTDFFWTIAHIHAILLSQKCLSTHSIKTQRSWVTKWLNNFPTLTKEKFGLWSPVVLTFLITSSSGKWRR